MVKDMDQVSILIRMVIYIMVRGKKDIKMEMENIMK